MSHTWWLFYPWQLQGNLRNSTRLESSVQKSLCVFLFASLFLCLWNLLLCQSNDNQEENPSSSRSYLCPENSHIWNSLSSQNQTLKTIQQHWGATRYVIVKQKRWRDLSGYFPLTTLDPNSGMSRPPPGARPQTAPTVPLLDQASRVLESWAKMATEKPWFGTSYGRMAGFDAWNMLYFKIYICF